MDISSDCNCSSEGGLTLRALSLFFKILPISNVGDYCIYFGHRSLSLPQTWLLFRHEVLLPPTCLPGLESQIKCSVLPLLTGTGANKMTPLHVGTSYTHDFRFHSKGNASGMHHSAWAGSQNPQIAWAARGLRPLQTPH